VSVRTGLFKRFLQPALMRLAFALAVSVTAGPLLGCVEPPAVVLLALDKCAVSPEGALCDDGQPCTVNDQCIANVCVGVVALDGTLCTDGDVCTLNDLCDKGKCIGLPAPDNSPCTDGDPCTTTDVCRAAKCIPGPARDCDDGNICTADMCLAGVGCQNMSVGDCSQPPEMPTDGPRDMSPEMSVDLPSDLVGPDAGDVADGVRPEVTDLPVDLPDVSPPETEVADVVEASPDIVAEAAPDAPRETPAELPDAAVETIPTVIDLRARGGACDCELGDSSSAPGHGAGLAVTGLLLAGAWRRRRRGRPV
jgi:MYXO-CTERM domain-containing protein